MIITTDRLSLREITQNDLDSLKKIMQNPVVMYAYEGPFTDQEVQAWLDKQLRRYQELGFGLWTVVLKDTGEMIGQCGLTMQDFKDNQVLEIGYLFQEQYWHKGYASEAAIACKKYAFETLKADNVYSIIRDTNIPSQNVAIRNGMKIVDTFIKHYRGIDMAHYLYGIAREEYIED